MIYEKDDSLYLRNGRELVRIQPWGANSFRVQTTHYDKFKDNLNALLPLADKVNNVQVEVDEDGATGSITNGKITAKIDRWHKISYFNQDNKLLLDEYQRNLAGGSDVGQAGEEIDTSLVEHFNSALNLDPREFKAIPGGDFELRARFEANPDERIYGMGQYQQNFVNLKNASLELAHRNSQASVPFYVSSIGYGFLWNNPAIGDVKFSKNITEWHAFSTMDLDYWITAGDTPKEIEECYANVAGKVPMMPEYGLGYWQCKLRYQTQTELLNAAREFKKRNLPIDVIVIDFFHWAKSGDFSFDKKYWPDPTAMTEELHKMGIKLMVSVWPTVDQTGDNYEEMNENGYLVGTDRGIPITMTFQGNNGFVDFTNPEAQKYVWSLIKKNYYDNGVDFFWLDEAEPEFTIYDFDNYRYEKGSVLQVGNRYPLDYSKTFYDGLQSEGKTKIVNLVRTAWAGSQRYGALVWSGDIDSSFRSMRDQLAIGLNMGLAGIPWWTTDIGGFHGGVDSSPDFQELVTRWLQFATFCPVMRMHGDREPHTLPLSTEGGGKMPAGAGTEPWNYGEDAYEIMVRYMNLRENLRDYTRSTMKEAHENGDPVMRTLFYNFPSDKNAWEVEDEFMFGDSILVAPVLHATDEAKSRQVYLPKDQDWVNAITGETISGGQTITCQLDMNNIPIFITANDYPNLKAAFKSVAVTQ